MKKLAIAVTILVGVMTSGCGPRVMFETRDDRPQPGTLIKLEHLKGYASTTLKLLLWFAHVPEPVKISNGIELYRVTYWTSLEGKPIEATGLMSVPRPALHGEPTKGLEIFLHGTLPSGSPAPSAPSDDNGLLSATLIGGGGYLHLAPDYVGLGPHFVPHPYFVTAPTVAAVRDMIPAARRAAEMLKVEWPDQLYLVGFSQGGHAVAAVQRSIEELPSRDVTLAASATLAGPFDLAEVSIPYAFANHQSFYLAYLANSYCHYYRKSTDSLLQPPWAMKVPALFDGTHSLEQIEAALPKSPEELFRPEMLKHLLVKDDNWFTKALRENSAHRWVPKTRLRLYFGQDDKDVSPEDSHRFFEYAKARGGNVEFIALGPYDHGGTVMHGMPRVQEWFDTIAVTRRR